MNVKFLEVIAKAGEGLVSIANKITDGADSEKFVKSVEELDKSVDSTYDKIEEMIMQDSTLSAEEKCDKLEKIAKSRLSAKQTCAETIKENRENVAKVVGEVFLALATCGISYVPKLIKANQHQQVDAIELKPAEIEE